MGSFKDCKGKDSGNYSVVNVQTSDAQCTQDSIVATFGALIATKANGKKAIINLANLAKSRYPAGGEIHLYHGDFYDLRISPS